MRRAAVAAAAALLATPAAAGAETRYVSPAGADAGACPRAAPCSAAFAIGGAGSMPGDTVVVLPGLYEEQPLVVPRPLAIVAPADRPRPVFRSRAPGAVALTVTADAGGTLVEHLDFRARGEGALGADLQAAAVLDDVRVTSAGAPCVRSAATGVRLEDSTFTLTGTTGVPCLETTGSDTTWTGLAVRALAGETAAVFEGNGAITDVVARGGLNGLVVRGSPDVHRVTATGGERGIVLEGDALVTDTVAVAREGGTALLGVSGAHHIVNLTAWGVRRGSVGVRAGPGAELTVKNTIARARTADLVADPGGRMLVDHSNFRTALGVTGAGPNVATAPRFVEPAFENFRLRRGSPAIDAGNFEINASSADRAGRFRWLGARPDMGAYEYAPRRRLRPRLDRRAPAVRGLALSRTRFRPARRGVAFTAARRARRAPRGTLLRWFLSERADLVVLLRRTGRDRPVLGTIVHPAKLGWGTLRLNGRVNGRRLAPGRYLVTVMARDVTQNLSRHRHFVVEIL